MATEKLTNVIIRLATEADISLLAEFIQPFVEEGDLLPRTIPELSELLPTLFVAEIDGRILGCAALEIYSWKLSEIRSLAVSKEAQGKGIGRKLVKACVDLAHERNILEVMAITASDEFFMSCGFDYTLPSLKRALFIQTREI